MVTHVRNRRSHRRILGRILVDGIMLLFAAYIILPFMWIITTSLRVPKNAFTLPPHFFPTMFDFANYAQVFKQVPFWSFGFNSLKIAVSIVVIQGFVSTMAAYAFARIPFPGRQVIFMVFLSGLMIPGSVIIIPQFIGMSHLHLINSDWSLVITGLINPLGIFLIRQMMMGIPQSYDEAAFIDGASRFWVFWKVILPMSMPAVIVTSVMTFVANWNDFFRPLIFLNSWNKMTLPLGMTVLQGVFGTGNLSAILAGVTLALIPPLLFYIFGQKYLLEGMSIGGLKG